LRYNLRDHVRPTLRVHELVPAILVAIEQRPHGRRHSSWRLEEGHISVWRQLCAAVGNRVEHRVHDCPVIAEHLQDVAARSLVREMEPIRAWDQRSAWHLHRRVEGEIGELIIRETDTARRCRGRQGDECGDERPGNEESGHHVPPYFSEGRSALRHISLQCQRDAFPLPRLIVYRVERLTSRPVRGARICAAAVDFSHQPTLAQRVFAAAC
jgi:hypothetical protein